jgi:hypothetical protein
MAPILMYNRYFDMISMCIIILDVLSPYTVEHCRMLYQCLIISAFVGLENGT